MVYSDSLKIKAILKAPKHIDYSNLEFKFAEFPDGLELLFFDELGNQNKVIADYAILYTETKLIDLKGNVELKSYDGSLLKTNQLYWDSENEWLFTEQEFIFQDGKYDFSAKRLDGNKDFSKFFTGNLIGTVSVSDDQDTLSKKE